MSLASIEAVLRARGELLPGCLAAVADGLSPEPRTDETFVVTGIGASEGPARAMAALLHRTWGVRASFAPLSSFLVEESPARRDVLVVFSQSISPNARIALRRAHAFARVVVFTSATHDDELDRLVASSRGKMRVVTLPARDGPAREALRNEHGTLVRMLGPSSAMLAAALATGAGLAADVPALLDAVVGAGARASKATADVTDHEIEGRVAFVTAGGYGELCAGIATYWLEALYAPRPLELDVLALAHGPFQSFYDGSMLLVALERPGRESELFDRLGRMLVPERHRLVRLTSTLPIGLAPIDHLTQVHELVCRASRADPRDPAAWPGRGCDAPLYDLDGDAPVETSA